MPLTLPDNYQDKGYSGFANKVLYEMCNNEPWHNDQEVVEGKLSLIGRFYLASPTRGAGLARSENSPNLYAELALKMCKDGKIDRLINSARRSGRVSQDNLSGLLETHCYLSELVVNTIHEWRNENTSRNVRGRTSFVSKYLHFHAPLAFFIYDSVIRGKMQEIFPKYRRKTRDGKYVPEYARLSEMLLKYAGDNCSSSISWTPRSVDAELYGYSYIPWRSGS